MSKLRFPGYDGRIGTGNLIFALLGFIGLNSVLLWNAGLISLFLLRFEVKSWAKLLLSIFIIFSAEIILSEMVLGVFGTITYVNVWILHVVTFVLVSALFYRKKPKQIIFPEMPKLDSTPFLVLGPFVILFLLRYFYTLFQLPMEYDTVAYHLPIVVEWYKTGSLLPIYYNAFAGPMGYYPSNFELFELWTILPFGKDFFVNFINFFQFPVLIVATYEVLRNLKLSSAARWLGVGFLLYTPIMAHFMGYTHVDLFFTITFIIALYFLQEYWKEKAWADLFLAGLTTGIFVGTKYLGVPYALPLLVIAAVAIIKNNSRKSLMASAIALFASGGALGGGFWYIRNWIQAGNPLFPTDITVAGKTIFGGFYGMTERIFGFSLYNNLYDAAHVKEFVLGFLQKAGVQTFLVPVAAVIIVLAAFFQLGKMLAGRLEKKEKSAVVRDCIVGAVILLAAAFYFYLYIRAPYSYSTLVANVRYAVMYFFVGALLVAFAADRSRSVRLFMYLVLPTMAMYNIAFFVINKLQISIVEGDKIVLDYQFLIDHPRSLAVFIFWTALSGVCVFLCIKSATVKKTKLLFRAVAVGSVMLFVATTTSLFAKTLPQREILKDYFFKQYLTKEPLGTLSFSQVATWFDEHEPNAKIAYTGSAYHYYLYGRSLQREVDYININECLECRYVDYKDSKASIRRDPNFDNWMSNLRAKERQYLVVAPDLTKGVKSWEFVWANEHPKNFEKVLQRDAVYVYRIM